MSKRNATTELNHDNWNDVEEPEERGTFRKATPDVIERRIIKAAKRRSTGVTDSPDVKRSPFAGLGSFKMASTSSSPSPSSSSPFSFLNHVKESNISSSVLKNGSSTNNTDSAIKNDASTSNFKVASESASDKSKDTGVNNDEKSGDYYSKLKALNESVSDWIRLHVNKNPFCILTPIFKDYEQYLVEIEKTQKSSIESTLQDSKSIFATDCSKKPSLGVSSNSVSSKTTENETSKSNSIGTTSKVANKSPMFTFGNSQDQNKDSKFNSIFAKAHSRPETEISKKPSENSSPVSEKDGNPLMVNPFTSPPSSKPSFFGASASAPLSVGFSFGSGSTTNANNSNATKANEEEYQPPKPVFTPVQEEGAAYSKRCKVFVRKDSSYQDRGVGTLYLKPIEEKTQLIVRADTSIGNLLMNCLLNSTMSPQKMGDKNIMLVCLPTPESKPPPVPVLLKVKTSEDADELLAKLKEFIDKRK